MMNLAWSAALKGEADPTVSTLVVEKSRGTIGGRNHWRAGLLLCRREYIDSVHEESIDENYSTTTIWVFSVLSLKSYFGFKGEKKCRTLGKCHWIVQVIDGCC